MRSRIIFLVAVGIVGLAPALLKSAGPQGQTRFSGSADYQVFCVSCHGPSAKGDGVLAGALRKRPADLTQLMKKHDGVYPADSVFKTLEDGHEQADMPAWAGILAKSKESEGPDAAKERIRQLVKYLETLQQKP
jgi:mono/diheme cytochrome c family protein